MATMNSAPAGQDGAGSSPAPSVSVVSAVYNVAEYLPDFFASLREQTLDHRLIEVILVDDGSTDASFALCQRFAAEWDGPATVVTKQNGGQSSARNVGMEIAAGRWLNFPDADDLLSDNFFEALVGFAERGENAEAAVHTAHLLVFREATGTTSDSHSMKFRFNGRDRIVDLRSRPDHVHHSVATAIIRADVIKQHDIRFDENVRPRFEDAHFMARILLARDAPIIGYVSSAKYIYRKRAARNSSIDRALLDFRSYTHVPRYGHLGLLQEAERSEEVPPQWLQNLILYDIMWMFKDSQEPALRSGRIPSEIYDEFLGLLDRILARLTEDSIRAFDLMPVPDSVQRALLLRKHGISHSAPVMGRVDPVRNLVSLRYIYLDGAPEERFSVRGMAVQPRYAAEWNLELLGRPFACERKVWLSAAGEVRVWFGSIAQPIRGSYRDGMTAQYSRNAIRTRLARSRYDRVPARFRQLDGSIRTHWKHVTTMRWRSMRRAIQRACSWNTYSDFMLWLAIRSTPVRRRYDGAWVIMDRDTQANDNGEIFYKWLLRNRPRTKAYFVLRKGVPDWHRLRAEGLRPIAYGSRRWKMLMLMAHHVASSHADSYITNPLPVVRYGHPQWRFTFLQHGVVQGDISRWLNRKKIDVFVTSTEEEYKHVSGRGPYRFGTREVRLTGLARFDELLAKSSELGASERRYILVAPTWRQYLAGAVVNGNERAVRADFGQSFYAASIRNLLQSGALAQVARAAGATIAFLPHPNIQPNLEHFEVPGHVEVLRYADVDIRDVIARTRTLITDYSSIAFDAGYLYRHVIYFQFDRDEFFGGGHISSPGYFDYATHGFGPVVQTVDDVVSAVDSVLTGSIDKKYALRMRNTFPVRDGQNCKRTFAAMRAASKRHSFRRAAVPAQLDSWERFRH